MILQKNTLSLQKIFDDFPEHFFRLQFFSINYSYMKLFVKNRMIIYYLKKYDHP